MVMAQRGTFVILFNKFYHLIKKISNWPIWFISLVVFLACYLVENSDFIGIEHVKQLSGGANILDMFLFYTPDKVYDQLVLLGEAGRSAYLTVNAIDFIFPLTYALFLGISMTMSHTFLYPPESKKHLLVLLPLLTLLADYGENIAIRAILLNYPARLMEAALAASILTPIKYVFFVASALIIVQGNMNVTNKLFGKK